MKKIKEFWDNCKIYIIGGFIATILVSVGIWNESIGNIIDIIYLVIFGIFVIAFVSVLSYFLIRKKLFLRKIDPKDLDIVKKYAKKKYHELEIIESIDYESKHEFSLYDEFCDVWDMANMFGECKKLYNIDIALTDEFIKYVKKLDNKEINKILEDSKKVKEIIFKYYDENGVWKNQK